MGEVDPQTWGMAIPQYGYIIEALTMGHIGMGTRSPVYNLDMNNLENNCDCLPVLVRVFSHRIGPKGDSRWEPSYEMKMVCAEGPSSLFKASLTQIHTPEMRKNSTVLPT